VRTLDIDYWKQEDLNRIAIEGYRKLHVSFNDKTINRFSSEAAGSPQLMQLIGLQSCFEFGIREVLGDPKTLDVSDANCRIVFECASTATDFRSLVDVLDGGPKTRGTERNVYEFRNGVKGDVYRCVLTAIASDPPKLSFAYDEILQRTRDICVGDAPVGSSVTGSCVQMSRLAQDRFPNERVLDWDEQKQVLDVPNPYFLFFLRWSDRLMQA